MKFIDSLLGRRRAVPANLDALFSVPSAALTMQSALGLNPTGTGAVCYRAAAGAGFAGAQQDITALIAAGENAPQVTMSTDDFGFTWLQVHRDEGSADDVAGLATDLHAVNTTLEMEGFGAALLCSIICFEDAQGRKVGLVYLYKQGNFYPFAPMPSGQQRDNMLELQIRDAVAGDLPIEGNLQRWLAVWGAPGL